MMLARNNLNFHSKSKGITLITLLLIIAVIAVLAGISITVERQHQERLIVEKTAIEMKNLLEASVGYYSEVGTWPEQLSALVDEEFLPETSICSPWSAKTSSSAAAAAAGPEGGGCKNKQEYSAKIPAGTNPGAEGALDTVVEHPTFFGVSIDVDNENMAKQVAGLLPSTIITNKTIVTSYVPIPGALDNKNEIIDRFAQVEFEDSITIPKPTCHEEGWEPQITYGLSGFEGYIDPDEPARNGLVTQAAINESETADSWELSADVQSQSWQWYNREENAAGETRFKSSPATGNCNINGSCQGNKAEIFYITKCAKLQG